MDDLFYKNVFNNNDGDHPSKESLYKTFYYQIKIHETLKNKYSKHPPKPYSYDKESLDISNIILNNLIDEIEHYPSTNLYKAKNLNDIFLNCIVPELVYEICEREKGNIIGLVIIENNGWIKIYYSKHYIAYRASSSSENVDKSDRIKIKEYIINLFKKF